MYMLLLRSFIQLLAVIVHHYVFLTFLSRNEDHLTRGLAEVSNQQLLF